MGRQAGGAARLGGDRRAYRGRRHFGSLDGLRAIAVVAVVWHHTVVPVPGLPITGRGFLGVDLFFVLSGYLIVTLLLREHDRTGTISLRGFYARRSLRIFPLYYTILAAMAALVYVSGSQSVAASAFRETLPFHLTYTSNWFGMGALLAVSWSLAAEEQFYLLWPPIQRWLGRFALVALAALLAANQLVNFGLVLGSLQDEREIGQVTFTPILLGVALAYLLHHRYDVVAPLVNHPVSAPAMAVALVVVANFPNDTVSLVGVHRLTIHLLMTLLLASVVVTERHGLSRVLTVQPLVRIGAISYGVYLLHMFVRHVAVIVLDRTGIDAALALFAVTTVGTLLAAEASFRYFESPILRLKGRFTPDRHGPPPAPETAPGPAPGPSALPSTP